MHRSVCTMYRMFNMYEISKFAENIKYLPINKYFRTDNNNIRLNCER